MDISIAQTVFESIILTQGPNQVILRSFKRSYVGKLRKNRKLSLCDNNKYKINKEYIKMRYSLLAMVSGFEGLEALRPIYKQIVLVKIQGQSNYALINIGQTNMQQNQKGENMLVGLTPIQDQLRHLLISFLCLFFEINEMPLVNATESKDNSSSLVYDMKALCLYLKGGFLNMNQYNYQTIQIMNENLQAKAQELDPTRTRTIGSYVIGKTLGKGTFGKVKSATHIPTGEKVAIKILEKEKIIDVADVERVSREIHILKLIRHPNIIQLYEIIETPKQLFLIMEYMESGELFDYIVKCKKIAEDEACTIFQQIIGGIQYIHKLNIVHRDLKPENLLIDYDRSIRLVDFGLSNTYRKEERLKTACGSPCYAAPEMIEGKNRYEAIMVDIWSSGVILYAMLCGCLPFQDPETSKLYQKILAGQYKIPKTLSQDAKDMLSHILTVDPTKRYRIEDIRRHKWWNLSPPQMNSQGLIVGYHRIPIDDQILKATVQLGFQHSFTRKCIEANRHNDATTTYYLLLKKFVRDGGISKAYLGSKYFDSTLIEPLRKVAPDSIIAFDQTAPNFNSKQVPIAEKNSNSQPGIGRKMYHLVNNVISRRREFSNKEQSSDRAKLRQLYTPSSKLGTSLKAREDRTISVDKSSYESVTRPGKETISHPARENNNDAINRKYKETYGISLISKSKERQRSRKKSLKKYELSEIYEKAELNKTLMPYNRGKAKSNRIGVDKGFENNLNTIDNIYRKPHANRRFIYH